jgi:hypothetical protein
MTTDKIWNKVCVDKFRQTTEGLNLGSGYCLWILVRDGDTRKNGLSAITPALPPPAK